MISEIKNDQLAYPAAFSEYDSVWLKKRMLIDRYQQQLLQQWVQDNNVTIKILKKARL